MIQEIHNHIMDWMEYVAEQLRQSNVSMLNIEEKTGAHDLVTEMDKWAEEYLVKKIKQHYPEHKILGEEGTGKKIRSTTGYLWIIDPLDGTLNFVKGHNNFGIMIGVFKDGEPLAGYIYDVMKYDCYYGIVGMGAYKNGDRLTPILYDSIEESLIIGNVMNLINNCYNFQSLAKKSLGVRSYGSAALQIISVLNGEASLYFSCGLNPWDFAAGYAICNAMGLKVSNPLGNSVNILEYSPVLFAHPGVFEEAVALLSK